MKSKPRYLLLVSCSQRKHTVPGLMPAIDRYDGVNFRVLKKAKREGIIPPTLDILILSAKYGLIKPNKLIRAYDFRMQRNRALALQAQVSSTLDQNLKENHYEGIFINLGKLYLPAIELSSQLKAHSPSVQYALGGIGKKMSQMKAWLYGLSADKET